jgi:hypothetical protein
MLLHYPSLHHDCAMGINIRQRKNALWGIQRDTGGLRIISLSSYFFFTIIYFGQKLYPTEPINSINKELVFSYTKSIAVIFSYTSIPCCFRSLVACSHSANQQTWSNSRQQQSLPFTPAHKQYPLFPLSLSIPSHSFLPRPLIPLKPRLPHLAPFTLNHLASIVIQPQVLKLLCAGTNLLGCNFL